MNMTLATAAVASPPGVSGASLPVVRILVIDDEEDQFALVRRVLARFDTPRFAVDWAENYSAGLLKVATGAYDVCLVDYRLGMMDGVQLISEARQTQPDVPFILITGRGDRAVDMQAMSAGAIDYLSKAALDGPSLERVIRYAMTQQSLMNSLRRDGARARALDVVSQALAEDGPNARGLDSVLDVIDSCLGYGMSAIYLLAGDRLTLGATRGFRKPHRELQAQSGPLTRPLAEGRPCIVPSWTEPAGSGPPCEFVLPLVFESRVVGILTIAVSDEQPLDGADQRVTLEIGSRVAAAIGIHQERTSLGDRLSMLRRATEFTQAAMSEPPGSDHLDRLVSRLSGAFTADGYAVALIDDNDELLVRSATGSLADRTGRSVGQPHSVAARARERRCAQVDSSGTSCSAYTVIADGGRTLGLLWVDRRGLDAQYTTLETEALTFLGNQLGVVLSVARERASARSAGVRDDLTGLYSRPFLDALLKTYAGMDGTAPAPFGLVLAAPRLDEQVGIVEEQRLLQVLSSVALKQVAGGPDVVVRYGAASVAILVREQVEVRTVAVAEALAAVTGTPGIVDVAAGCTVRARADLESLASSAEMALELSRRTRSVVQA